jgi:hypothetical protein
VRAEHVHGVIGDGVGLRVVAESGHEEEVANFSRQGGQGGASGDEGDARRLRHRAGRKGKGGVIQTADGRHLVYFDQLCGPVGGGGLIRLAIDGDHLDQPASDAASGVDLVCRQSETIQPRFVDRRHAAGHAVERTDFDRLARRLGRGSHRRGRHGASCQQQADHHRQTKQLPTVLHRGFLLVPAITGVSWACGVHVLRSLMIDVISTCMACRDSTTVGRFVGANGLA